MKKLLLFISINFMLVFGTNAQSPDSKLEIGNLSSQLLESLILQKINNHRSEKNLKTLKNSEALAKAAANHSSYQGNKKKLTHEQDNVNLKTPSLRVHKFKGKFNLVGENVALVSWDNSSTYASIAEDFFQAWMNSPPHYENIINPDFRNSGIRFRFSKDAQTKGSVLYATHVFAGPQARYFSTVEVPNDGYGLSPFNERCKDYYYGKNISEVLANFLIVQKDSIFIHYHNLEQIRNYVLAQEKHGLAIDIVERQQFPCTSPNLIDETGVSKGILLPPKYREELLENNPLKEQKQFVGFLGVLPKGLVDNYQLNIIHINDNCSCVNSTYLDIPANDIPLVEIKPIWHTTFKVKELSYNETVQKVQFVKGKSTLAFNELEKLKDVYKTYQSSIQRIHIFATSSVEGNSADNDELGAARAEYIKQIFVEAGFSPNWINYHTLERWDMFRRQIKGTPFAFLLELTNKQIQKRLNSDKILAKKIEPILAQERITQVTFKISNGEKLKAIEFDEKTLLKNFEEAVQQKNFDRALEIQSKMIYAFVNDKLSKATLLSSQLPLEKEYIPFLSNQMAVELFFGDYIPHAVLIPNWGDPFFDVNQDFVDKLSKLVDLSNNHLPLQFNLNAFAVKYMRYTQSSFMDVKELYLNILKFSDHKLYGKLSEWNQFEIERLKLNFHLAAVDYFYTKFDYKKRENSLKYILKHYSKQQLQTSELLFLAKYFNKNFRFSWAIDLLKKSLKDSPNHEELFFTYLKTRTLKENLNEISEEYKLLIEQALNLNSSKWCNWVNSNFQLLNVPYLKNMYCKECG